MATINSRQAGLPPMPSRYQIGDLVYFQPQIDKIDGKTGESDLSAVHCKVVGVAFTENRVYYDLALPYGAHGEFYEESPICCVDPFYVVTIKRCDKPALFTTGWVCTRGMGHDGPCAAIPIGDEQ